MFNYFQFQWGKTTVSVLLEKCQICCPRSVVAYSAEVARRAVPIRQSFRGGKYLSSTRLLQNDT